MRQHGDFGICALARLKKFDLQVRREEAPIKVKDRKRDQNDNQRDSLRQLPSRSFQFPRRNHYNRERNRQPSANSASNKKGQRRGGDRSVGSDSEVGVE